MNPESELTGILLAGGASRRFGQDKLLHCMPGGTPMALASAHALKAALPRIFAVVRQDNKPLIDLFAANNIEIVIAGQARKGMGASLAAGVAAAAEASGWLIALADMPFIRPQTIAGVADALCRGAPIAAPSYQGQRGHPVGFSKRFSSKLCQLHGDEGARRILQNYAAELVLVDCNDPGILMDIDQR